MRLPRDGLPQIALAGRSNVGKSSLINALARKKIARTSAAPGKTRLVNIYRIELGEARRISLYLVDLPGYGYARGGTDASAELRAIAEAYFAVRGSRLVARGPNSAQAGATRMETSREPRTANHGTRAALLLIDSRHPNLESDHAAAAWLAQLGIETHIVATKIDKLTRAERARNLKTLGDTFGSAALPISAATGEGLDELWRMIVKIARDAGTHA